MIRLGSIALQLWVLCCVVTRIASLILKPYIVSKSGTALRASLKPITYKPISIPAFENEILVRDGAQDVMDTLSTWTDSNAEDIEMEKVDEWINNGKAFWATPQGTRAMIRSETQAARRGMSLAEVTDDTKAMAFRRNKMPLAVNMYINKGSKKKPVYMKTDGFSTSASRFTGQSVMFSSNSYENVTQLFEEEQMQHRFDYIARKLNNEFSPTSEEWAIWTNKTSEYGITSLTEAFAAYQRDCSIGDVGGKDIDYVPQRGYIGTLAPGEKYVDQNPTENHPKRILHPWPAAQEISWYVRMPVTHPLIPPGPLFAALNGMYDDNFTYHAVNTPCDEIRGGGAFIRAEDAVRIAELGNIGRCFEPAHQLKHGGMKFDYGTNMGAYNPDHGPTYDYNESLPKVPERLRPVVQKFLDPLFGLDIPSPKLELEDHEIDDAQREEEVRRLAFEALLDSYDEVPEWKIKEDGRKELLEKEIETRFEEQRADLIDIWNPDKENIPYPIVRGLDYLETATIDDESPFDAVYADYGDEVVEGLSKDESKLLNEIDEDGSTVVFRTFEGIQDEITGYEIIKKDALQQYNEKVKASILQERMTAQSWWEAAHLGKIRGTRDVITYVVHTATDMKDSKLSKAQGGQFRQQKRRRRKGESDDAVPKGRPKRAPRKSKTRAKAKETIESKETSEE